jgi:hypothetical protein
MDPHVVDLRTQKARRSEHAQISAMNSYRDEQHDRKLLRESFFARKNLSELRRNDVK